MPTILGLLDEVSGVALISYVLAVPSFRAFRETETQLGSTSSLSFTILKARVPHQPLSVRVELNESPASSKSVVTAPPPSTVAKLLMLGV